MLTDLAIKQVIREARNKGEVKKRFDGRGLFILAKPTGAALWRYKYRRDGKEKLISLGDYATTSLKAARAKHADAMKLVAANIDPSAVRKAAKLARADSVEAIATEWINKLELSPGTIRRDRQRLEKWIYPHIGKEPIASIEPPVLLSALQRIEAENKKDTALRVRALCGRIWRYAIGTGRCRRDISADLRDALPPAATKSYGAIIDPRQVGELLRRIDAYEGQPTVKCALKLAPLVFVRPGELRAAEWAEFDLDSETPEWRIRAERMKMKEAHIVPLSRQAVAILREVEKHSGGGRLVFPSMRGAHRPMSENTINVALRAMGYTGDVQTGHGFRTLASTLLNELGQDGDVIELQLAHRPRNQVRAVYNRATKLEARRTLMQFWADHLDRLRANDGKVVPFKKRVAK